MYNFATPARIAMPRCPHADVFAFQCTSARRLMARAVLVGALGFAGASAAGTNLGVDGYPRPDCAAGPVAPQRPVKFKTEAALQAYNREVEVYNEHMERLVRCIQNYVDNASQDIKRIREFARKAVDQVR